jgi:hypothetical protein
MNLATNVLLTSTISAIVVGCANLAPVATPSGKPEVTIASKNVSRIKSDLVSKVSADGYSVVQDTTYSLVVSKQMEGSGAVLYQAALGNVNSSQPQMNISFTIAPTDDTTHVFAHLNIGMQGAFGQNQGTNLDNGKAAHQVQSLLEQVKADIEALPAD